MKNFLQKRKEIKVIKHQDFVLVKYKTHEYKISDTDFFMGIPCFQLAEKSTVKDFDVLSQNFNEFSSLKPKDIFGKKISSYEAYHSEVDKLIEENSRLAHLKLNDDIQSEINFIGAIRLGGNKNYLNYKNFNIDYRLTFGNMDVFGYRRIYFVRLNDNTARLISAKCFIPEITFEELYERENHTDISELHYEIPYESYMRIIQAINTCLMLPISTNQVRKVQSRRTIFHPRTKTLEDYKDKKKYYSSKSKLIDYLINYLFSIIPVYIGSKNYQELKEYFQQRESSTKNKE